MLESVKIQRRQSEIRPSLSELVGKEPPTDDEVRQISTLDAEFRTNETRYRGALIAEDEERREAGAELETRSEREFPSWCPASRCARSCWPSMKARPCPARPPRS